MSHYILVYYYDEDYDLAILGAFINQHDADYFIEKEQPKYDFTLRQKHCKTGIRTYQFEL